MLGHLSALWYLAVRPEPNAPRRWLLKRPTILGRRFAKCAVVQSNACGEFAEICINNERFVWPASANVNGLLHIVAEQSEYHPHRYDWGNTRIKSGDIVIDVGACEGSFSAYATGRGAKVICIEPSATMRRAILRLFELRGLDAPVLVGKLIGRNEGSCYFYEDRANMGASRVVAGQQPGSYPVEVTPLDTVVRDLQLPRVDFIKCDAEGADLDILMSARETIRAYKPRIAITTYHAHEHYRSMFNMLKDFGYDIRGKGFLYNHRRYVVLMLHAS